MKQIIEPCKLQQLRAVVNQSKVRLCLRYSLLVSVFALASMSAVSQVPNGVDTMPLIRALFHSTEPITVDTITRAFPKIIAKRFTQESDDIQAFDFSFDKESKIPAMSLAFNNHNSDSRLYVSFQSCVSQRDIKNVFGENPEVLSSPSNSDFVPPPPGIPEQKRQEKDVKPVNNLRYSLEKVGFTRVLTWEFNNTPCVQFAIMNDQTEGN